MGSFQPRRAKSDNNQTQVIQDLRDFGCTVDDVSQHGRGYDLVVGFRMLNLLVELKNPNLSPSSQVLTEKEEEFIRSWNGGIVKAQYASEILRWFRDFIRKFDMVEIATSLKGSIRKLEELEALRFAQLRTLTGRKVRSDKARKIK